MIRPAHRRDLATLESIAQDTGMFLGDELCHFMGELRALLNSDHDGPPEGRRLLVATETDDPQSSVHGAAYIAPEMMAQGVMNLLFIGVASAARQRGLGEALLQAFEAQAHHQGARLTIIETAGDPMFAPAWALYQKAGYTEEARIRDYFDDGLDKLVFRKML